MALDKKLIWAISLLELKMGRSANKTNLNINNAFGKGNINERIVQWWPKKFCKVDESPEDKKSNGRLWEAGTY